MRKQLPTNRLKELRKQADLKPYDISARYRVDPSTVYRWENGRTTVPDEVKLDLARLYEVSVSHLMGWEHEGIAA